MGGKEEVVVFEFFSGGDARADEGGLVCFHFEHAGVEGGEGLAQGLEIVIEVTWDVGAGAAVVATLVLVCVMTAVGAEEDLAFIAEAFAAAHEFGDHEELLGETGKGGGGRAAWVETEGGQEDGFGARARRGSGVIGPTIGFRDCRTDKAFVFAGAADDLVVALFEEM